MTTLTASRAILRLFTAALLAAGLCTATAATAQSPTLLSARADTGQEVGGVAAGTPAAAAGGATLVYDPASGTLSWNVEFDNLSGDASGMHFHGPAAAGVNAGVEVNLGAISGLTSPSAGSVTLDARQAADLLAGLWYLNVHTALNGGGEIRGQVLALPDTRELISTLDQQQEVPAPTPVGSAGGRARLSYDADSNLLGWAITFDGLSGAPLGMHFHGPAAPGETASVQIDIGAASGLRSPSVGAATLTDPQEQQLLAGLWYINIHTDANRAGEIRGQVLDRRIFGDGFELTDTVRDRE